MKSQPKVYISKGYYKLILYITVSIIQINNIVCYGQDKEFYNYSIPFKYSKSSPPNTKWSELDGFLNRNAKRTKYQMTLLDLTSDSTGLLRWININDSNLGLDSIRDKSPLFPLPEEIIGTNYVYYYEYFENIIFISMNGFKNESLTSICLYDTTKFNSIIKYDSVLGVGIPNNYSSNSSRFMLNSDTAYIDPLFLHNHDIEENYLNFDSLLNDK